MVSSARAQGIASRPAANNTIVLTLLIRFELQPQVSLEQRRIGWLRQRRCLEHRGFDGSAHRLVAVALTHPHAHHLATRHLRHVHDAVDARAGGRWAVPVPLHSRLDLRDILLEEAGAHRGVAAFLFGEAALELRFTLLRKARFVRLALLLCRGLRLLFLLLLGGELRRRDALALRLLRLLALLLELLELLFLGLAVS